MSTPETREAHWADHAAEALMKTRPGQTHFTLASGITPSGTVHIGNFRELITVDLVRRALERKGATTRFIFSWDNYDVFRKVPANMPQQDLLKTFLGKPIVKTPDPFGIESSYARHHEKNMETSISKVGVTPEFLYQEKKYRACEYAEPMRKALQNKEAIAGILNQYREEPLPPEWTPLSIFCESCDSNETKISKWDGDYGVDYICHSCKHSASLDLRKSGAAKLLWRVDWPMRWACEKVDFEPGGKDHSTAGGSFDTAKQIVKAVWNREPPHYLMYDFIRIKGRGGKISSSKGEVVTLDDCLRIYEPEMVRWIFASYRPGVEFAISFDLDVIKLYEDFDRLERRYYGHEIVEADQLDLVKRVYELSAVSKPQAAMPFQPAFRHLTNVLQINLLDFQKTREHYAPHLKTPQDEARFETRLACAAAWLAEHAPEDFKFSLRAQRADGLVLPAHLPAVTELHQMVAGANLADEEAVHAAIFEIVKKHDLEASAFFKTLYQALIARDRGPKLASFLAIVGKEKILALLDFKP